MWRTACASRAAIAIGVVSAVMAVGCAPRQETTGAGPPESDAPAIEAKATEALKRMGERLKNATAFRVRSEVTLDKVLPSGQKIQLGRSSDVSVRRPDRLYAASTGDERNLRFWYDGKNMTLHGSKQNLYASFDAPPTLDEALDHGFEKFGLVPPSADLLFSDPYAVLMANVKGAAYVGLHRVGGVRCHHLAFTQEAIDWQIWIEEGKDVPRKLVITYKEVPASPQFTVVLSDWDETVKLPDSLFVFKPPEGAERIEFLPRAEK
jgi:hypothetical protein